MQKMIIVKVLADGTGPYDFKEVKEVNEYLEKGWTVDQVHPTKAPKKTFYNCYLVVLKSPTKPARAFAS